ncbi:hypothetical protein CYMTET_12783 [Cymbomonas tetramitiformis]|uniref:Right handed beta helix domain-containing protein n=1 Tax=Cymbomonas tetramitiformis TaxID=36881 RepID=A0AAE0GJS0_9CHLO|nr:hypothetical protein CYMTET_12783 [Cymbomonas tetramitiformis]
MRRKCMVAAVLLVIWFLSSPCVFALESFSAQVAPDFSTWVLDVPLPADFSCPTYIILKPADESATCIPDVAVEAIRIHLQAFRFDDGPLEDLHEDLREEIKGSTMYREFRTLTGRPAAEGVTEPNQACPMAWQLANRGRFPSSTRGEEDLYDSGEEDLYDEASRGTNGSDSGNTSSNVCSNSCIGLVHDGYCNDGGEDAHDSLCACGTDCSDCGPRPDCQECVTDGKYGWADGGNESVPCAFYMDHVACQDPREDMPYDNEDMPYGWCYTSWSIESGDDDSPGYGWGSCSSGCPYHQPTGSAQLSNGTIISNQSTVASITADSSDSFADLAVVIGNLTRVQVVILATDVLLTAALPPVERSLVLTGQCEDRNDSLCVIDGNAKYRILQVLSGGWEVYLERLVLTRGKVTNADGGALMVDEGSTAMLFNCVLQDNWAGSVLCEDICYDEYDDYCDDGGGGSWSTKYCPYGTDCKDCGARYEYGGRGGAVYAGSNVSLSLHGCVLSGNSAQEGGGGIYVSAEASLILDATEVNGNDVGHLTGCVDDPEYRWMSPEDGMAYGCDEIIDVLWHRLLSQATPPRGCRSLTAQAAQAAVNFTAEDQAEVIERCPVACAVCPTPFGCSDTCYFAHDGQCDDMGPGSKWWPEQGHFCELGTDCTDCGQAHGYGGAVYLEQGALLTMAATRLVHNNVSGRGGGVHSDGAGELRLENSSVVEFNIADDAGGGVSMERHGDGAEGRLVLATGSSVSGNAAGGYGGGIYTHGVVEAEGDLSVSHNCATLGGGGVWLGEGSSASFSAGCVLEGNDGGLELPGGVFVGAMGRLELNGASVVENLAGYGGGLAVGHGGAIVVRNGSTVGYNRAYDGDGGGIYMQEDAAVALEDGVRLCHNSAARDGGAISMSSGSRAYIASGTEIAHSAAGRNGAGINADQSNVSLSGCSVMSGSVPGGSGGGLFVSGESVLQIQDSYVTGNQASEGGGVWIGGYVTSSEQASDTASAPLTFLLIEGSVISNNTATVQAGGLWADSCVAALVVGTRVEDNSAQRSCGGLLFFNNAALLESTLRMNTVVEDGGGGCVWGGKLAMNRSVISFNTAVHQGGAVDVYHGELVLCESVLERNSVTQGPGGALMILGSLRINSSSVLSNYASSEGGGIYVASSTAHTTMLTGIRIAHNSCGGHGGGLAAGGLVKINGSEVSDNFASLDGGGIYLLTSGILWVHQTNVSLNYAGYEGGGIRCMEKSQVRLTARTNITENRSGKWGGGMSVAGGVNASLVMDGFCSVSYNVVDRYSGGGISAQSLNYAALLNVTLVGNKAELNGGAIHMDNCIMYLEGIYAFANAAGLDGGAIFLEFNSQLAASNTLFLSNTAASIGGAISAVSSTVQLGSKTSLDSLQTRQRRRRRRWLQDQLPARGAERGSAPARALLTHAGLPEQQVPSAVAECDHDVCVDGNAAHTGAAIFMSGAHGVLRDVRLQANRALDGECLQVASQVALSHRSSMHLEASALLGNQGTGIEVGDACSATLDQVHVQGHLAESGAGVYVAEGGAAALAECTIDSNRAGSKGGGLYSAGQLSVTRSHFVANHAAQAGGGMHLQQSNDIIVELRECNFTNNSAYDGAALYIKVSDLDRNGTAYLSSDGSSTSLSQERDVTEESRFVLLTFEGNSAEGGGSTVFWEPDTELQVIACTDDCVVNVTEAGNRAGYQSALGWASRIFALRVAATQTEEASGSALATGIRVEVIDMFGQVVVVDSESEVELHSAQDSPCTFSGEGFKLVVSAGAATFLDVIPHGDPGATCLFYVESSQGKKKVASNQTAMPLRYCASGEHLEGVAGSRVCSRCKQHTISFDNVSACMSCEEDGLTDKIRCLGGDEYVICPGFWLSPNAQYCDRDDDGTTQCFLKRLYECDHAAPCIADGDDADTCDADQNSGRQGAGIGSISGLTLCNTRMYMDSVMCGGTASVLCGEGHYANVASSECLECPGSTVVLLQFIGMLCVITIIAVVVVIAFLKMSTVDPAAVKIMVTQSTALELMKAKNAASLIIGYVQVMSQISSIYSGSLMSPLLQNILWSLTLVSLDMSTVIKSSCMSYHFGLFRRSSAYWLAFWQSVLMPWLLCAFFFFVYFYLATVHRLKKAKEKAHRKGNTEDETETKVAELEWHIKTKSSCIGTALFLMMFIHPSISTTLFQVFNCVTVQYDSESLTAQKWLRMDTTYECNTFNWYAAAAVSGCTIIGFVLGFPVLLFLAMWRLRRFHAVRLPRVAAEHHVGRVQRGEWIPCDSKELAMVHLHGSFRPRMNRSPREDVANAAHGPVPPKVARLARRWWQRVDKQKREWVEMYIPRDSFVSGVGENEATRQQELQSEEVGQLASNPTNQCWKELGPTARVRVRQTMMRRFGIFEGPSTAAESTGTGKWSWILLRDGALIKHAELQRKEDEGNLGVTQMVPITRLDAPNFSKILGQFLMPFEDAVYAWQTIEIMRRMMQTGLVVVMTMLCGEDAALVYATCVAVVALLLHERYSPYKNDALDKLQSVILLNQFLVQILLVLIKLEERLINSIGLCIVVLQCLLLTYSMTLIIPAFRPAITALMTKSALVVALFSRRDESRAARNTERDSRPRDIQLSDEEMTNMAGNPIYGRDSAVWTTKPALATWDEDPAQGETDADATAPGGRKEGIHVAGGNGSIAV